MVRFVNWSLLFPLVGSDNEEVSCPLILLLFCQKVENVLRNLGIELDPLGAFWSSASASACFPFKTFTGPQPIKLTLMLQLIGVGPAEHQAWRTSMGCDGVDDDGLDALAKCICKAFRGLQSKKPRMFAKKRAIKRARCRDEHVPDLAAAIVGILCDLPSDFVELAEEAFQDMMDDNEVSVSASQSDVGMDDTGNAMQSPSIPPRSQLVPVSLQGLEYDDDVTNMSTDKTDASYQDQLDCLVAQLRKKLKL